MELAPRRRRLELADALRRRVVGALASGSIRRGERLPSAREVAAEVDADPRLVLAAYRILAKEGVVEIRRRSGIYVARSPEVLGGPAVVADGWVVDVLAEGIEHGIAAPRLGEWLKRCAGTRRVRAAVVADTIDQLEAFCSELREDYGVDPVPFAPEAVRGATLPPEMYAADFILTADGYAERLRGMVGMVGIAPRPVIAVQVRPTLPTAWRRILSRTSIHAVVADARSMHGLDSTLGDLAPRLKVYVVGRDDVRQIPPASHVYVSRSARRRLGSTTIAGRLLPMERAFSGETVREVLGIVVELNLRAMVS
ncbi:MAG TPA: GntR family transcriptional regulator [Gemmatirosa sp.]